MRENEQVNVIKGKSIFTVKMILRVLSLLCIVFVFCPAFIVSCSGQDLNVSVMTAVGGVSAYGEKVVDPHPIMLIALLLPIAMLVLLFIKKFTDNKTALIILACSVMDFITWLIFRSSVKKIAEDNYCSFKTTAWFVFNIISLILIMILAALAVMLKMQLDSDLIEIFSGGGAKNTLDQMSSAVTQMSSAVSQMAGNVAANIGNKAPKEKAIGYCAKCGSPIAYGCKFCTSCGTPVPESMLAEAEAARAAAEGARLTAEQERLAAEEARLAAERARAATEEAARKESEKQAVEAAQADQVMQSEVGGFLFCQQCGAKLAPDAIFCESCGTKIE